MYEGTEPVLGRPSVPFTIIDIDDTYRAWKEPLAIPREALLQLIQFAVEQGAMAVVVDVDLSDRTGAETSWAITQYLKARPLPGPAQSRGTHRPRAQSQWCLSAASSCPERGQAARVFARQRGAGGAGLVLGITAVRSRRGLRGAPLAPVAGHVWSQPG